MAVTYTPVYNLGKQEDHANKFDMKVITDNVDKIEEALSGKVDKSPGKGLSTNDFTDAYKQKLLELENYNDTGIKSETALNRSTLGYQRKNLLKNTAVSQTMNGVTFTVNADGSVTANGTSAAGSDFYIAGGWNSKEVLLEKGDYIISCDGLIQGAKLNVLDFSNGVTQKAYSITQASGTKLTNVQITGIYIKIFKDVTATDLILKPMIRCAEITDDTYEPYKPSVEERLAALEAAITGGGEA